MESTHPLTAFRKKHNPPLSQAKLAGLLGVSRVSVTRWESGKRRIDDELVPIVAEKTGIPPRKLRPDVAEMMKRPGAAA